MQLHDGPLAVDKQGKVRRGVFSTEPVEQAEYAAQRHADDYSNGRYQWLHFAYGVPSPDGEESPEHIHVGHAGETGWGGDGGEPDEGDLDVWEVAHHELGDHVATQLEDHLGDEVRRWHQRGDEPDHLVTMDHSHSWRLANLISGVERQYPSLRSWLRLGEGGTGDAEAAIDELDGLVERLRTADPPDDEEGQIEPQHADSRRGAASRPLSRPTRRAGASRRIAAKGVGSVARRVATGEARRRRPDGHRLNGGSPPLTPLPHHPCRLDQ